MRPIASSEIFEDMAALATSVPHFHSRTGSEASGSPDSLHRHGGSKVRIDKTVAETTSRPGSATNGHSADSVARIPACDELAERSQ